MKHWTMWFILSSALLQATHWNIYSQNIMNEKQTRMRGYNTPGYSMDEFRLDAREYQKHKRQTERWTKVRKFCRKRLVKYKSLSMN